MAIPLTTTPANAFPIVVEIQVQSRVTVPVPSFTIHFHDPVDVGGIFDVDWFDPTMVENPPANPRRLGLANGSGNTLTFVPPPHETLTLLPDVEYDLSIFRDVSAAYPGGANSVVLPVQPGRQQELAVTGPLGAGAFYQSSATTGFLQWQTIAGAPQGIPPLIFGDVPIESVVASATQVLNLPTVTVTGEFTPPVATAARFGPSASAAAPGPGTFVPDANPTVVGPFPAQVIGNKVVFVATQPGGFTLGGSKAWDFSIATVTVCAPLDVHKACDDGTPRNLRTAVPENSQFAVLVADESGLLAADYSVEASPPCSIESQGADNNGDVPPGYHDGPKGPKAEFDVESGAQPGVCTITASFNGSQVSRMTIEVSSGSLRSSSAIRYTLRPPVNGPKGYGISGKLR